jgi:hypothetical protein
MSGVLSRARQDRHVARARHRLLDAAEAADRLHLAERPERLPELVAGVAVDLQDRAALQRLGDGAVARDVVDRVEADLHLQDRDSRAPRPGGPPRRHRLGLAVVDEAHQRQAVAHLAAEEVVDRDAELLPLQVEQRHVDAGVRELVVGQRPLHRLAAGGRRHRVAADSAGARCARMLVSIPSALSP